MQAQLHDHHDRKATKPTAKQAKEKEQEPKDPKDSRRDHYRGQDHSSLETDDYKPQPPRKRRSKCVQ